MSQVHFQFKRICLQITLLLFVLFVTISCANNKSDSEKKEVVDSTLQSPKTSDSVTVLAAGLRSMECFYMTEAQVNTYITNPIGNKEIILQFLSNTVTAANPELKVCSYLATDHATHGIGTPKYTLLSFNPVQRCLTFLNNTEYIFGNNYVTARKLKNYIDNLSNPANYILKFTPNLDAENHVYFTFTAIELITLKPLATKKPVILGTNDTNPSPPHNPAN